MSSPLTAGGCPPAAYPVLVPVSRGCPGLRGQVAYVLLTRSPLAARECRANDLHVLGTPPAFVLSQDQTLRLSLSLSLKYTLRDSLPQDRRLLYVLFLFRLSEIAARRPSAASPYNLPPIAALVNPFSGFFSKKFFDRASSIKKGDDHNVFTSTLLPNASSSIFGNSVLCLPCQMAIPLYPFA